MAPPAHLTNPRLPCGMFFLFSLFLLILSHLSFVHFLKEAKSLVYYHYYYHTTRFREEVMDPNYYLSSPPRNFPNNISAALSFAGTTSLLYHSTNAALRKRESRRNLFLNSIFISKPRLCKKVGNFKDFQNCPEF